MSSRSGLPPKWVCSERREPEIEDAVHFSKLSGLSVANADPSGLRKKLQGAGASPSDREFVHAANLPSKATWLQEGFAAVPCSLRENSEPVDESVAHGPLPAKSAGKSNDDSAPDERLRSARSPCSAAPAHSPPLHFSLLLSMRVQDLFEASAAGAVVTCTMASHFSLGSVEPFLVLVLYLLPRIVV